jgi:alkylation response protein AidB-like acyl-CoA dehydrogenase
MGKSTGCIPISISASSARTSNCAAAVPMAAEAISLALHGRDPDESEVVAELCRSIGAFARESIDPARIDREGHVPAAVIDGLRELGVFGLAIPEAYGGAGLSLHGVCAVQQAIARHDRSVAATVGAHSSLGTRALVAFGSDAQRAEWLPPLAAGRRLAGFATTEPGAGSDLSAISTRATADGDGLVVSGSKVYITNGRLAGMFTVTAVTPELGGLSLLLLDATDPGLSAGAELSKLGLRGSSTTSLHFDGVRVPRDRIVGAPGQCMEQLRHVLAWGRALTAAGCIGSSAAAIEATLAHVNTRKQFGATLGALDVVRRQVADMAALHFMMVALLRHACAAADDPARLLARSLAAKVLCSDAAWEVCDTAVQLHGGAGFIEDTGLPLLLRDCRIMRIFEGANDVLLAYAGSVAATAALRREPLADKVSGSVAPLAARADRLRGSLDGLRGELAATHGVRLFRVQAELHRLGRVAVLSEAADAAVLRAQAEADPRSEALADHWLHLAEERVAVALARGPSLGAVAELTAHLYAEGIR